MYSLYPAIPAEHDSFCFQMNSRPTHLKPILDHDRLVSTTPTQSQIMIVWLGLQNSSCEPVVMHDIQLLRPEEDTTLLAESRDGLLSSRAPFFAVLSRRGCRGGVLGTGSSSSPGIWVILWSRFGRLYDHLGNFFPTMFRQNCLSENYIALCRYDFLLQE